MRLTEQDIVYAHQVMARFRAMQTHDFDDTEYCVACGQSRESVIDYQTSCFGGEHTNIAAISHLRAAATLSAHLNRPTEKLISLMRSPSPREDPPDTVA